METDMDDMDIERQNFTSLQFEIREVGERYGNG
jgi:hypothetical protein